MQGFGIFQFARNDVEFELVTPHQFTRVARAQVMRGVVPQRWVEAQPAASLQRLQGNLRRSTSLLTGSDIHYQMTTIPSC